MRRTLSVPLVLALASLTGIADASAEPRWTIVRTPSLAVVGDQPASTLRDVAVQLEQFRTVVSGLITGASRPPSLPTHVFVFGTRGALRPYLPLVSNRPASLAGFFQRDGDVNTIAMSLERMDESSAVAYHEYTHLLVGNAVRSIPVWLNEGLAEYYSTYRLVDGGRDAEIGRPPEGRLALLRQDSLPMASVIAVDRSSALFNESDKRSIFYAEAWAMTHYVLTQLPNGGEAINTYVGAIAEGRPAYEAFFAAFARTPEEFDRVLRVYVQRNLFSGTRFSFSEKVAAPEPSQGRTLSAGEANAWLGDLQRRVGRESEAAPRIDAAAAADPDVSVTHLAAGLLRLAQERTGEGLLEMERAAALAPDDFETRFLHGIWLLRADLEGSTRQSDSALQALTRASTIRPDSSDVLAWLAYAQMQNRSTLDDAQRSIERAVALAPGRADFRLRWADVRVLQGAYADARQLLSQMAALRTDPRAADGAQERLDRLDEYEQREQRKRDEAAAAVTRIRLRPTQPGEERIGGLLTRVECADGLVRFRLDTGERTIVTGAVPLDSLEMYSYRDAKPLSLACGDQAAPERVYLTVRGAAAVALEFLPPGFTP